jgi:hypothetical protein
LERGKSEKGARCKRRVLELKKRKAVEFEQIFQRSEKIGESSTEARIANNKARGYKIILRIILVYKGFP